MEGKRASEHRSLKFEESQSVVGLSVKSIEIRAIATDFPLRYIIGDQAPISTNFVIFFKPTPEFIRRLCLSSSAPCGISSFQSEITQRASNISSIHRNCSKWAFIQFIHPLSRTSFRTRVCVGKPLQPQPQMAVCNDLYRHWKPTSKSGKSP